MNRELSAQVLTVLQAILFMLISPLSVGFVQWQKARLQGRRGPRPIQAYRDLWKLLRITPTRPETSSAVFLIAPGIAFSSYALLGLALPTIAARIGPGMDLLLVIGLISLARFAVTLGAFDTGSPFGPMSAGRQWFIQVLAEPALLVLTYILALNSGTTNLSELVARAPRFSLLQSYPAIALALGALFFVLLAETGRLPFDRPGTHLELTMIEEGVGLEYSGRALALLWWSYAMKLTFALSLVAFLAWPPTGPILSWDRIALSGFFYLVKLCVLLVVLALWETARGKMRLGAIRPQMILAIGVLLFTLATLVLREAGV